MSRLAPDGPANRDRRAPRLGAWVGLCLAAAVVCGGTVLAQTPIGGPVTSNTALLASDSPFRVTTDLIVQNGATLSIQPGVTVYVAAGANIIVESGAIRADGTETSPILITSDEDDGTGTPAPGDWGVLRFEDGTNDAATRLTRTTIRYGSGILLQSASPRFDFCDLTHMAGPAMTIDLDSFPSGLGNSASGCDVNGILVPAGDITGTGSWALRGIPYVVRGQVSVGVSPGLSDITPSTVERLDTVDVVVTGQRLDQVTSFDVSGTGVTPTILPGGSDIELNVRLDVAEDAALGPRSFSVVTPAGAAFSDDAGLSITVVPAIPVLTAISPDAVVAGSGLFTLTVNGQRFVTGAEVVVEGTPVPTTRLSPTQMTAEVEGTLIDSAGTRSVIVRNPDPANVGMFLASLPQTLTVESPQISLAPDPLLVISGQVANFVLSVPLVAPAGGLTFDLVSTNAAVAAVPAQVTIAEGGSSVPVQVTGGTTGSATITASRAGFVSAMAQADVVPPPILVPVTPLLAPPVGVQVGPPPMPSGDLVVNPESAPAVGVVVGPALLAVAPEKATRGSSGVAITASGVALDDVVAVALEPGDGITIDSGPTVAPDGSSVEFTISIAADAEPTVRKVVLQTATGNVPAAGSGADQFLVTRAAPVVTSVAPLEVVPGSIVTLTLRGTDLQDASGVDAAPADDLTFANPPTAAADGTSLTVDLLVGASAALGPRVLTATTPGGTSSGVGVAANTIQVVAELGTPFTPLAAPPVGVVVTVPEPPQADLAVGPLVANSIGVVVGPAIFGVTPERANIGTDNLDVTVAGVGLDAVTSAAFDPADGITINSGPTPAVDGSSVALNISIAPDAPPLQRLVRLDTASGRVPAAGPGADRFTVTLPPPQIVSLIPNRGLVGNSLTLTINGVDLDEATTVTFDPPDGVAIENPPSVNASGTSATSQIVIDGAAPLGQRLVRITTPGGTSTDTASAANQFEVTDQPGTLITPLTAPSVGVVVSVQPPGQQDETVGPFVAPPVGVVVTEPEPPEATFSVTPLLAAPVGVAVGGAVTGVMPPAVTPGTASLDLTVTGANLGGVTAVTLEPADGITVNGAPVIAGDGTSLTVNLSVAIDAPRGPRRVLAATAAGTLQAVEPGVDLLFVGDAPVILSIDPNTVAIGSVFSLTINGTDLDGAVRVDVLPPDDVTIGAVTAQADGTQATVPIALAGAITPGARVVTITTAAGTSSSSATAANTLNIVGSMALALPVAPPARSEQAPPLQPAREAASPVLGRLTIPGPRGREHSGNFESPQALILSQRRRDGSRSLTQRALLRLPVLVDTVPEHPPAGESQIFLPTGIVSGARVWLGLPRPPTSVVEPGKTRPIHHQTS